MQKGKKKMSASPEEEVSIFVIGKDCRMYTIFLQLVQSVFFFQHQVESCWFLQKCMLNFVSSSA